MNQIESLSKLETDNQKGIIYKEQGPPFVEINWDESSDIEETK